MECLRIDYVNEIVNDNELIIYANILTKNSSFQINYSESLDDGYETAKQILIDKFNNNYQIIEEEIIEEE